MPRTKPKPEDWLEEGTQKNELIKGWLRDGITIEQLANNIGVDRTTIYNWMKENSTFSTLIKNFREAEIREVENCLLEQCRKGNTAAIIFYLKNKHELKWKDKIDQLVDQTAINKLDSILNGLKDDANANNINK